jgi:archaellum component FlaC
VLDEIRKRMAKTDGTLSDLSKTIGPEARKFSELLESFEEIKSDIERLGK